MGLYAFESGQRGMRSHYQNHSKTICSQWSIREHMNRLPIIGAAVGLVAGGMLGILALTIVANGTVAVALGFAGGMGIIGSLLVLMAVSGS